MALFTDELPVGTQRLYQALRDAGVPAQPQRDVAWIVQAADGFYVLNVWRELLEERNGGVVAVVGARTWDTDTKKTEKKRKAVVDVLIHQHRCLIRVVVIERDEKTEKTAGARFDSSGPWLVEDTGTDFLLWRGRDAFETDIFIPPSPAAYGNLTPGRRTVVSSKIERDARVRKVTLQRAGNRCEIATCLDQGDFERIDVHHITPLGQRGSDHTDNTVALCPACHARVHRGNAAVQARVEAAIVAVMSRR